MPQLHAFPRDQIPAHFACQIRSYSRIQWPGLNASTALWPPFADPSLHFLLTDGDLLIAHAATRIRAIIHNNITYQIAGLSTVFTYPDYRGQGHGQRIIQVVTDHIRASGADCAMLFCGDRILPLYIRLGWQHLPTARIMYGTPPALKTDNHILMLFLSPVGKSSRLIWENEIVHVGASTW